MPTWTDLLKEQKQSHHFQSVMQHVATRRQQGVTVYPPEDKVFEAFRLTDFDDIRVVILGQDPYHGAGQAHGLCFSVAKNIPLPPSLKIFIKSSNLILASSLPAMVSSKPGQIKVFSC